MSKTLVLFLAMTSAGCASFTTTSLSRLDDNSFVGASNGWPKFFCHGARPYKGVPITLSVPTHVDLYIDETYYLGPSTDPYVLTEAPVGRLRTVRTETIRTKKVFISDFKRPGAGSLGLTQTFTDDQYWEKINSKIDDDTIAESAKLVATVLKNLPGISTSNDGEEKTTRSTNYERQTRVVAYQRFDMNDPLFEQAMADFVSLHLADCE